MKVQTLGRARGFTLIELLIAIAIVGILASVAFPAYTSYVRRGKIAAALAEMTAVRVRLEQYYQDNRKYGATGGTTCGVTMPSSTGFTFACETSSAGQAFLITATGLASQNIGGFSYTVDQQDQQKTVTFDGATLNASCWMKKKGDTC
jgi:type IV pilus assembly protein PilE